MVTFLDLPETGLFIYPLSSAHVFCEVYISIASCLLTYPSHRTTALHESLASSKGQQDMPRLPVIHSLFFLPFVWSLNTCASVAVDLDTIQRFTVNAVEKEPPMPRLVAGEPVPQSHRQITYNTIGLFLSNVYFGIPINHDDCLQMSRFSPTSK